MLSKNVIGIDLGASFTKLAYREGFSQGRVNRFEEREAHPIRIDGEELIPTLAIETGRDDRPWVFGMQAAEVKPGPRMKVHRNWKSRLLKANGDPPDDETFEVASAFFTWLHGKLREENTVPFKPDEALVKLCVPAFKGSGATLKRLAAVMEEAGWGNEFVLRTSEPKANTIGFCTKGRNIRTTFDTPNWGDMFDMNHPFIQYTRNPAATNTATLAVLDIGSFTSDLSLIDWRPGKNEGYLNDGSQVSFQHGIVDQLDAICLPPVLEDSGESVDSLGFGELEELKKRLYRGDTYEIGGYEVGDEGHRGKINKAMSDFCEELWHQLANLLHSKPVRWYILTGGGANIPRIRDDLSNRFKNSRCKGSVPDPLDDDEASRGDTALGATSLILIIPNGSEATTSACPGPKLKPPPPLRSCPCGGGNKNCMRCGGTGTLGDVPPPDRIQRPVNRARPVPQPETAEVQEEIEELEPEDVTPPDDERDSGADIVETSDASFRDYTLEGWMGSLVFGTTPESLNHTYTKFRKELTSDDMEVRNRVWFRLLCLACALGAKVPRSTIQKFWKTTLEKTGFWEITTGKSRDPSKLDQFFEDMIHREFRSVYAAGEQAELLRRVFYDFRKLHFLTYENDFSEVILEILDAIEQGANPVLFLRSGALPNGGIWRGVIGQSMTSPLLFLMREWRRLGLIQSDRMDHYCYYMNSAGRRGAYRKGWLSIEDLYAYSLADILEASRKVHLKLQETEEWEPELFDIPLQALGSRRRRRKS